MPHATAGTGQETWQEGVSVPCSGVGVTGGMGGAEGFGGDSSQVARGELRAEEGGELEVVRGTGGGLGTPATVERGGQGGQGLREVRYAEVSGVDGDWDGESARGGGGGGGGDGKVSGGGKLFVSEGEDPSVTPTQVRGREKGRGEAGEEGEESGVLSLEGVAKSERKRPVDGVGWDMVGEGRPIPRGVG